MSHLTKDGFIDRRVRPGPEEEECCALGRSLRGCCRMYDLCQRSVDRELEDEP